MKITYIAWKQVISSDVKRLVYGTRGRGARNTGDHAIQNFNTINQNPGLWRGFTGGEPIPLRTGINIPLRNSVNPLNPWLSSNNGRNDPIKISQGIWDRRSGHENQIIEPWYLGYMRILRQLLQRIVERDGDSNDAHRLLSFVTLRLCRDIEIRNDVLQWIHDTQDRFCRRTFDLSFLEDRNIARLKNFIEEYYYLVIKCKDEDDGDSYNLALMANSTCESLHPEIRRLLNSAKSGGENVNIDTLYPPAALEILSELYTHKNIILYGPPGTGKTHLLTELARAFNIGKVIFDDLDTEAPFRATAGVTENVWCTFHPNYSYETFVCGLTPVITAGNKLGFKPHIGPMLKLAKKAESGIKSLLIIDEINRANTDAVFGNSIAVIDPLMNDTVSLPSAVTDEEGNEIREFSSSDNLFVIGTMNSLDKSISPLSAEFKRRFCIVELAPDLEVLRNSLLRNTTISSEIADFACDIMDLLNKKIHNFCGKEYELGQGYFWGLVEAQDNHEEILAEIIRNKIIPHLRDVIPADSISEFFGEENLDVMYSTSESGSDINDCSVLSNAQILNAFSKTIGSTKHFDDEESPVSLQTLEDYESEKIEKIKRHLDLYKNVIISGCSGTGKTYYVSKIMEDKNFSIMSKSHWHSSTEYADVIEGISATVNGNTVKYSVQPGAIRRLAENPAPGAKLMVIENINKSNAAENFGELITLLEPDKRHLHIAGYEGPITLPSDIYFLCTMTPGIGTQKLDSALKRRFSIIEFGPDYKALSLKFGITEYEADDNFIDIDNLDSNGFKRLAILFLRKINKTIKKYIGADAQFGHAVFWDFDEQCCFSDFCKLIDNKIIPVLVDYCTDEDITKKIFGDMNPLVKHYKYGPEITRLELLDNKEKKTAAIEGMLKDE